MGWTIRAAVRDDADAIADVHIASWRAGYGHVIPESVLFADDFEPRRRAIWTEWRFGPAQRIIVSVDETDRVVGFATYGPERERGRGNTGRGELYAFYFHPDTWGSGAAADLMARVHERLGAEGFGEAVLWVLDDNSRARAFYERHGWSPTGIDADYDVHCELSVPEVEYRTILT